MMNHNPVLRTLSLRTALVRGATARRTAARRTIARLLLALVVATAGTGWSRAQSAPADPAQRSAAIQSLLDSGGVWVFRWNDLCFDLHRDFGRWLGRCGISGFGGGFFFFGAGGEEDSEREREERCEQVPN